MGSLFNLDSPVMVFLTKMADLIIVNLLAAICCIPIFTIGASMTALHYIVLKILRNEECYIVRGFFKSFKENFKQATIMWLIMLLVLAVFVGDFLIFQYSGISFPQWLKIAMIVIVVFAVFASMHAFPLLAKFDNSVKNTFKNSLYMGILTFPKTIAMMICWVIPVALAVFLPQVMPIVFCFGFSGPALLNAMLYNKSFKRFEPEEEQKDADAWFIEEEPEAESEEDNASDRNESEAASENLTEDAE